MVLSAQKQARPALSGRSVAELEQVIKDRLRSAVHALATDQPNLASIYMKRVLEHVAELRYLLAVSRTFRVVQDFCADVTDALLDVLAPAVAACETVINAFANLAQDVSRSVFETSKSDFALAAPR